MATARSLFRTALQSFGHAVPRATKGTSIALADKDATAFDVASYALPAAGAFAISEAIDLDGARVLALDVLYDAAAAGGYPVVMVLVSNSAAEPAFDADEWVELQVTDGSVAAAAAGAYPAGVVSTSSPDKGAVTFRGHKAIFEGAAGAATKLRAGLGFLVSHYRWARALVAEEGVVGTPGKIGLRVALSA